MMVVDDPGVVRIGRDARVETVHRPLERRGEGLNLFLGHQRIVRCHASLATIGKLTVGDAIGGVFDRGAALDDHRRLAAELERDRHEIFACCAHHQAADRRAAGEEDMVELEPGELGADLRVAGHHGDLVFVIELAQHGGEQLRRCWRELGRLQHDAIAGGDRRRKRRERERHRIVPGRDDADDAERLIDDSVRTGKEHHGGAAALGPHEAAEIAVQIFDGGNHRADVEQQRLLPCPVAEIVVERRHELLLAGQQRILQLHKIAAPRGERRGAVAQESRTLAIENEGEGALDLGAGVDWGNRVHGVHPFHCVLLDSV